MKNIFFIVAILLLLSCNLSSSPNYRNSFKPISDINRLISLKEIVGIYKMDTFSMSMMKIPKNNNCYVIIKEDTTMIMNNYISSNKNILKFDMYKIKFKFWSQLSKSKEINKNDYFNDLTFNKIDSIPQPMVLYDSLRNNYHLQFNYPMGNDTGDAYEVIYTKVSN